MNKRKNLLESKKGKPPVINDTTDYLRPRVTRSSQKGHKSLSKTLNLKKEMRIRNLLRSSGINEKVKEKPLFKYNDKYGGYLHLYEYIEDPGNKKPVEIKDEDYFKRR